MQRLCPPSEETLSIYPSLLASTNHRRARPILDAIGLSAFDPRLSYRIGCLGSVLDRSSKRASLPHVMLSSDYVGDDDDD